MSAYAKELPVSRVLVMVEYGAGIPGEVFDITALAREIAGREDSQHHHTTIECKVVASRDYAVSPEVNLKSTVAWNAMVDFRSSGESGHLDDAINASLPDSFATEDLRKKLRKVNERAEKLAAQIQTQRLMDAASVRGAHPIARINLPLSLPEAEQQLRPTVEVGA